MKRLTRVEILLAGFPLDARRDIDQSGAGQQDGLADGVGGEPTGQGEGRFRGRERAPVEDDAVAAGEHGPGRRFCIEQDVVGGARIGISLGDITRFRDSDGLHHRQA